jgi:rod shape-determining protein MreD
MLRPVWLAGLSAVLAGLLLDGLGAVPVGTSLIGMALLLAFCLLFGRRQMSESIVSCVLVTVGGSVLMTVLHYVTLRWNGNVPAMETSLLLARIVLNGAVAIPVGAVGALAAKALDHAALNTHSEKHADSFDWSGDRV